ncbi:hypothetical protein ONZ43_g7157 [Nemania bipapillata]|uniref:Uncharacterized protein n=1 Tax=Nemania bipapillata TaxID=110536 RepID=A0ACC2HUF5_9PEZI|nr:hypothetical protein ONZ43_g7157 [Nemania bipapillata]
MSPPSRAVDELDLAELSPRPEDALLAHGVPEHTAHNSSPSIVRNGGDPSMAYLQNKGDSARAQASVTFRDQEPPSPGAGRGAIHNYRPEKRASHRQHQQQHQQRQQRQQHQHTTKPPEIWRPSFVTESDPPYAEMHAGTAGPQLSFFGSMFMARPTYTERTPPTNVDRSFKLIERRERQMQQELQQLLDAQDYALEKHLASTTPDDERGQEQEQGQGQGQGREQAAPRSWTRVSDAPGGHVVPVRQPKKRQLSKKEARLGIARCMSLLSDLKNEEEAYIATALAERKAALSKLRNLTTKRNSIVAGMNAIESDSGQPLRNEIEKMEHQHRAICDDILKLEERLHGLKRTKNRLEGRIAEARSARDSELSGYKGALNECDKRIDDMMTYPGVSVLEVEGLMVQDADLRALAGQHISGFEFLSLRPERRTLPMAKDWWEGEVQVLELRKVAVDKERAALEEGTQLWQNMLSRLEEHDQHLKSTFDAMSAYAAMQPQLQRRRQEQTSSSTNLGEILKGQYTKCTETAHELEELYVYAETQGWKLLVTALGAEINYFQSLKAQLGDTLRFHAFPCKSAW